MIGSLEIAQTAKALQQTTLWLAVATEAISVAIIAFAVGRGAIDIAAGCLRRSQTRWAAPGADEPRLRLARSLALALEFLLAADIMRTAVAPTWREIGQLAAIAALRTALNIFIQREIDAASARAKLQLS
jgi:uncharacterized membrane protein